MDQSDLRIEFTWINSYWKYFENYAKFLNL